jgi:hypothetical protein
MAVGLLFFAGFSENGRDQSQTGQNSAISAIPVQLGRDSYGLAMIDDQTQTLWVYEFNTRGQTFERLRLIAARSFAYDRQLTEWNTAPPTPAQVKQIVEAAQAQQQQLQQKQQQKIEELQQLLEQD